MDLATSPARQARRPISRFSRMNSIQYRTWAPPESPIRIEYTAQLLREVRLESTHGDAGGVLFGVRHGNELRCWQLEAWSMNATLVWPASIPSASSPRALAARFS